MGWASTMEDIIERFVSSQDLADTSSDDISRDPNREARLRDMQRQLRQLCGEASAYLELASDPSCDLAHELIVARQHAEETALQLARFESEEQRLRENIDALVQECSKLKVKNDLLRDKMNEILANDPDRMYAMYDTPERRSHFKRSP